MVERASGILTFWLMNAHHCSFSLLFTQQCTKRPKRPKNGVYRAQQIRQNILSSFVFLVLKVSVVFLGVLIIPKWLITDSGSIAILFGWFLEPPKTRPNLDPRTLYLSPKPFKKYKKHYGDILEHIIYHIWESEIMISFEGMCTELLEILEFEILTPWTFYNQTI